MAYFKGQDYQAERQKMVIFGHPPLPGETEFL
ncbi:hypothetical protein SKA58_09046 [Sphingomonas sp. SKA58]|nr:hypothetical protein SKA58_09046 [Sphingomonas sp. SKA58]